MVEFYILSSSLILYVAMWVHKTHTTIVWEIFFIYKDILYTKHYVYRIDIYKYIRLPLCSQEKTCAPK